MTSRSFRLETRSRAKDEMKRIIQTIEKVRKWEKKWVDLGLSNSLRVYKWVPIRDDKPEEDDDDKENEPIELTDNPTSSDQAARGEHALPDISQVPQSSSGMSTVAMESPQVLSDQLPPDVLLTSDDPKEVAPSLPTPGDQTLSSSNQADTPRSTEVPATMEPGVGVATGGGAGEMDVSDMDQDRPESPFPSGDKSMSPLAGHGDREVRSRSREKQLSPSLDTRSRSRSRSPH